MTTLTSISARLADHYVSFCEIAMSRIVLQVPEAPYAADNNRPSDTQPMDVFDGMEDAVRRQVTERLRGPIPACPATSARSLEMNYHLHLIQGGNQSQLGSEQLTIQW